MDDGGKGALGNAIPAPWLDALRRAIGQTAPDARATMAQEGLDAVAVAAGLKPAAVLGCGYGDNALMAAVAAVPDSCGLVAVERRGWTESAGLPAWYGEPLQQAAEAERILLVGAAARRDEWEPLGRASVDADAVAIGLGYPACCVAKFHRRRGSYHLITVGMLTRQAAGDEHMMRRLARAQVLPTPRGEAEYQDLLSATRTVFAPFTSIAMCEPCERHADSPARRIGVDFARLARAIGFDAWLPGPA